MSVTLLYKAENVGPVCGRLAKAAKEANLTPFKVTDALNVKDNVVVRWGNVTSAIQAKIAINSTQAIVATRDKKKSRQLLGSLAPKTWYNLNDIQFPAVIRPRKHHAAKKFFVAKNLAQAKIMVKKCGLGWYASELVDKAREFRVFVLHGRIVAVSERFSGDSTIAAWNLAAGGKLINCKFKSWPIEVLRAAIDATKAVGLDFSAMDIAIEKNTGRVVVFEANTAPGLKNPYTLACIAKAFAYTESHELPKEVKAGATKWSSYLHPAVKPSNGN
jgi:glutathione synthase/RimK-type ligase-like ATP-grasp enzyme